MGREELALVGLVGRVLEVLLGGFLELVGDVVSGVGLPLPLQRQSSYLKDTRTLAR